VSDVRELSPPTIETTDGVAEELDPVLTVTPPARSPAESWLEMATDPEENNREDPLDMKRSPLDPSDEEALSIDTEPDLPPLSDAPLEIFTDPPLKVSDKLDPADMLKLPPVSPEPADNSTSPPAAVLEPVPTLSTIEPEEDAIEFPVRTDTSPLPLSDPSLLRTTTPSDPPWRSVFPARPDSINNEPESSPLDIKIDPPSLPDPAPITTEPPLDPADVDEDDPASNDILPALTPDSPVEIATEPDSADTTSIVRNSTEPPTPTPLDPPETTTDPPLPSSADPPATDTEPPDDAPSPRPPTIVNEPELSEDGRDDPLSINTDPPD